MEKNIAYKQIIYHKSNYITITAILFQFMISSLFAQSVGINSTSAAPASSAMLDIVASDKGLLIPRVALTGTNDVTTIASAATSLLVYNTAAVSDVTVGYYYWDGSAWKPFHGGLSGATYWSTTGNASTVDGTHFVGTTDNIPLNFKVNNIKSGKIDHLLNNTAWGYRSQSYMTTGTNNTSFGMDALAGCTTGTNNTAIGYAALKSNMASNNVAVGYNTLTANTYAQRNIAIGNEALTSQNYTNSSIAWNTDNIAIGYQALYTNNPTGDANGNRNIAVGSGAMYANTTGAYNIGIGYNALNAVTTGNYNTAIGHGSLMANSTRSYNTAFGRSALLGLTTGDYNTAFGFGAANEVITGDNNIYVGYNAGLEDQTGSNNISIGRQSDITNTNTSGSSSVTIGDGAKGRNSTGSYDVAIGINADQNNSTGGSNVIVGYEAGGNSANTRSRCVYLGYMAGFSGSSNDELYIENSSDGSNPLIYGSFSSNQVGIETSSTSAALTVGGTSKLGSSGTSITFMTNTTLNVWNNGVAWNNGTRFVETIAVSGVLLANPQIIIVSPQNALAGVIIEYARVSADGQVDVSFLNKTGANIASNAWIQNFYATIIQY